MDSTQRRHNRHHVLSMGGYLVLDGTDLLSLRRISLKMHTLANIGQPIIVRIIAE